MLVKGAPGNELSPVLHQAITWTNADRQLGSQEETTRKLNQNSIILIQENEFRNVISEMRAICLDLEVFQR